MVEKIYTIKNELLKRIENDIAESGIDRINVGEMGELVDMVKDLAKAESACWQAQYYRLVSEAMEPGAAGYTQASTGYTPMGYTQVQTPSARSGYGAIGHTELIEPIRSAMRSASPEERERLRGEIMAAI